MKRDKGCAGCDWNFGNLQWPCTYCKEYDLYIKGFRNSTKEIKLSKSIQKMICEIISAVIYIVLYEELRNNAKIQQKDNPTNGL